VNEFAPDVRTAIRWLVIVPPLALLGCAALIVVAAIVGLQPLWASPALSLSAVAHEGDSASVYRMVKRGVDPNQPGAVTISSQTVSLLPIDAAVESRQVETVLVLLNNGVRVTPADRDRLICLARASTAPDVERYFQSAFRVTESPDCSKVQLAPH
jgi:hypothetical protein